MNKFKFFIKCVKYIFGYAPDPYEEEVKKKPEKKEEPKEKPKEEKPKPEKKPKKVEKPKPKKTEPKKVEKKPVKPVKPVDPVDSLPGEIWKDTKYKGYQVSNVGRLRTSRGQIMKPKDGVRRYFLMINKEIIRVCIRDLVAEAFLTKPDVPEGKHLIIIHKNGDIDDARAENLQYAYEGMYDEDSPEEWRTISKLPKYEISNRGRCRHKPYWFRGEYVENCYLVLRTADYMFSVPKGDKMTYRADELVAEAFLTKPEINDDEKLYVHHRDGFSTSNYVENLEWRIIPKSWKKPIYKIGDKEINPVGLKFTKEGEPEPEPPEPPEPPVEPRIIQTRLNRERVTRLTHLKF